MVFCDNTAAKSRNRRNTHMYHLHSAAIRSRCSSNAATTAAMASAGFNVVVSCAGDLEKKVRFCFAINLKPVVSESEREKEKEASPGEQSTTTFTAANQPHEHTHTHTYYVLHTVILYRREREREQVWGERGKTFLQGYYHGHNLLRWRSNNNTAADPTG